MNKSDTKDGIIGCLTIMAIAFIFIDWKIAVPVILIVLIVSAYFLNILEEKKNINLEKKYGKKYSDAIRNRELEIGMTSEMVLKAYGKPAKIKKLQKENYMSEEWLWDEYVLRKTTKYKKYAKIVNGKLSEFGDI